MKRYKCHKHVLAARVVDILILGPHERRGSGEDEIGARLSFDPEGDTVTAVLVTRAWMSKHNPQKGGYFVRYDDGYESYSPAGAFLDGYTPI